VLLKTLVKEPALTGALVVLALAAIGPARDLAAQGQPPPQGTGLITGQVVDADSGKGIAYAPVALIGVPGPGTPAPQGRAGGPNRPFAVLADSQGRFFFGGLAAGSYVPQTEVHGYMSASPFRPVVLAEGASISNTRILLRRLSSLLGVVTDDAGTPVVGMMVRAFRRGATQGRPPSLLSVTQARTNDRGEYRLGSLTPDEYLVCACLADPIPFDGTLLTMLAARPVDLLGVAGRAITAGADTVSIDSALRTLPATFHPNTTMASRAERIRIAPGEDRANVDITITAAPGRRVSGRLVGAPSSVNAQMLRLRVDGDLPEAAAITQIPPMLVQPDGRFDFANVPPGQYVLEVTFRPGQRGGGPSGAALGFIGGRGAAMTPPPAAPQRVGAPLDPALDPLWAMEPISVGDRDITGLIVSLNRSLVVSGRVVFSGAAPQPNPQTLQRPVIQMLSVETGPMLRTYGSGIQPDGTFELRGILPGRYSLTTALTLPGWPTLRSITGPDGELTDTLLDLEARDLTSLVITVTDTPPTSVEVRVQPVPKDDMDAVWVRVFSADRRLWQEPFAAARRFRAMRANTTGVVTISGLPPGEYLVTTANENSTDWVTRAMLEKISGQAERFRLSESEKLMVEVRR
jgi:hypothetical protein